MRLYAVGCYHETSRFFFSPCVSYHAEMKASRDELKNSAHLLALCVYALDPARGHRSSHSFAVHSMMKILPSPRQTLPCLGNSANRHVKWPVDNGQSAPTVLAYARARSRYVELFMCTGSKTGKQRDQSASAVHNTPTVSQASSRIHSNSNMIVSNFDRHFFEPINS